MPTTTRQTTIPPPARSPLPLWHYGGRPTDADRPTLGLKALRCPVCGYDGQRLIRARQGWRDEAELCAQIHVEMDFHCQGCEQGWRISLFNENEATGEIMIDVTLVETVQAEDARMLMPAPLRDEDELDGP